MAVSDEWRDIKYKEIFEQETRGLTRRRQSDPTCKVEDFEGILNNLYIKDGADHDGRGSLQDTIISATIAAYECFIAEWKAEQGNQ
ncbi:MAG: hypothetical protein FWD13_01465 [Treponema sp.]|nr:hypothetical protein [Treponema sp.]